MTSNEKGKIRYVGGWAFKKSIEKAKCYIETNVTSVNPSVREQLKHEIMKLKITESFWQVVLHFMKTVNTKIL